MFTIVTLFGDVLDTSNIPARQSGLIPQLFLFYDQFTPKVCGVDGELAEAVDPDEVPFQFADLVKEFFRDQGIRGGLLDEVQDGIVGQVYRDLFYRLTLFAVPDQERRMERFCELRHGVERLILDAYLFGWDSKTQFSKKTKITKAQVSKLVRLRRGESASNKMGRPTIDGALRRLSIVPQITLPATRAADASDLESMLGDPFELGQSAMTMREFHLVTTVAVASRKANQSSGGSVDAKKLLALNLCVCFGIKKQRDLDRVVEQIYRVIDPRQRNPVVEVDCSEELADCGSALAGAERVLGWADSVPTDRGAAESERFGCNASVLVDNGAELTQFERGDGDVGSASTRCLRDRRMMDVMETYLLWRDHWLDTDDLLDQEQGDEVGTEARGELESPVPEKVVWSRDYGECEPYPQYPYPHYFTFGDSGEDDTLEQFSAGLGSRPQLPKPDLSTPSTTPELSANRLGDSCESSTTSLI